MAPQLWLCGTQPRTLSSSRGLHQLFEIHLIQCKMHSTLGHQRWKYHLEYTNSMCSFCTCNRKINTQDLLFMQNRHTFYLWSKSSKKLFPEPNVVLAIFSKLIKPKSESRVGMKHSGKSTCLAWNPWVWFPTLAKILNTFC